MLKKINKYRNLFLAAFSSLFVLLFFYKTNSTEYSSYLSTATQHFKTLENELDKTINYRSDELKYGFISEQWKKADFSDDINVHVYRKDSLIFWNTNQLPIHRFADIHFPSSGLLHLQNGWYFAKTKQVGSYVICASFLVKQDYSYKNSELINRWGPGFSIPFNAEISLDQSLGYPILSEKNSFIFSILPNEQQHLSKVESIWLMLLLLISIALWFFWLTRVKHKTLLKFYPLALFLILALRILSLKFEWFAFAKGSIAFESSLYGSNQWFPNLFEYFVNLIVIIFLMHQVIRMLRRVQGELLKKYVTFFLLFGSFILWFLYLYLTYGLIENSTISLEIDKLFSLDAFSFLAIGSLGVYFFSYYHFVRALIELGEVQGFSGSRLAVISFGMGCLCFLYEINWGHQLLLASMFPLVFYSLILFMVYRKKKTSQLGPGIILLLLFSVVTASMIDEFNERKEKDERELYAQQLITEKNIETELEYKNLSKDLQEDNFLRKFIGNPVAISSSSFQEGIERRIFNGYWERYEINFHLFDEAHLPLIDKLKASTTQYDELDEIIERAGTVSELDSNIFFIDDYTKQYNYIIRQEVVSKTGAKGVLFCTLKSKKIPEEIGFPRLLISSKSNVLKPLESYSIARYHDSRMITKYGEFNYPSSPDVFGKNISAQKGFFNYNKFNHFSLKKSETDMVVLSVRNNTFIDFITSFSYLFSLYGMLLMPLLFRVNAKNTFSRTLSLAMKIQIVLIALVFISLLAFGWGSGMFVTSQYNHLTNDVISEKLSSVETEVGVKLGSFDDLTISENGNYMQYILQKFARVFFTDINLYDRQGYLLASSRPKVYNIGLLSEQMNPTAMRHLKYLKESEFVHKENIGELDYSSAYKPFYSTKGNLLGYINLQHFGQQREFENQIQKFLVAIINVFILLLAISIILAIFISNWLTSPLRLLQENFSKVKFGKQNEQILYDKEDEIGSLVKDYNRKLEELEFTAQQLAKSERETAWREMAKQVAHEIKNPLTPMKLSVQQLLRTYNPDDPKSGDKLKKVAGSIIEQIDALTKIANEFSTFAKMPNPSEENLDIVALIEGVKDLFAHDERIQISLKTNKPTINLLVDKDQFVRVFNNLIKNATQAIPRDQKGTVDISLKASESYVEISITDNGIGIEPSKQEKIFVPYFTTKSTGTGLGLAMVKQIVENHKGKIDFTSTVGVGTTFNMILPTNES